MGATHQSEHVTAMELRRALIGTLKELAPAGGGRSVPTNLFCDALTELIVDLLTAVQPRTDDEIERLTALFHDKLEAAMAERDSAVGHA